MQKRRNKILELLTDENKLEVATLSELLDVSQVTVRKDLDELEKEGIIIREHGFAILKSMDNISGRIAYHYEAKKEIATRAAQLVNDGDTIMIESGSCCVLLADELCASKKDLIIITNSAFIANHIREKANFQIILLGGIYQSEAQVLVGPMVRECALNFCVDLFFIGTDGYSSKTGFTNRDQMRAQAVKDMAKQSENVVVLTESEKFKKRGIVPLNIKNTHFIVITDQNIDATSENELINNKVELIKI